MSEIYMSQLNFDYVTQVSQNMKYFLFKVRLSPSKKNCVMKSVFYLVLKALFVLKLFKFLSQHFDHVGKAA